MGHVKQKKKNYTCREEALSSRGLSNHSAHAVIISACKNTDRVDSGDNHNTSLVSGVDIKIVHRLIKLAGLTTTANATADLGAEVVDLIPHELLQSLLGELLVKELVLELVVPGAFTDDLDARIMKGLEVRVSESLIDRDTLLRVKGEHLGEEIDGKGVSLLANDLLEGNRVTTGERGDVLQSELVGDGLQIGASRRAKDVEDELELLLVIVTREDGVAHEELSEDATSGPDIDLVVVGLTRAHDFRGTVPASYDVLGEVLLLLETTSKTEIADLEVAVGVEEKVGRFEVTVDDVSGVDVLQTTENLVNEVLDVFIGESVVGVDDFVEISVHVIKNNEELLEVAISRDKITEANDVLVIEVTEEFDLTEDTLGIDKIGE